MKFLIGMRLISLKYTLESEVVNTIAWAYNVYMYVYKCETISVVVSCQQSTTVILVLL
jgi:hypothetical protein